MIHVETCPHCHSPKTHKLTDIDLAHNMVLLHKLQAMLDDEKTKHGGTINPDNRDSWATAYIKAKALQNMLSQFISEIGLHLPVSRKPRRFL